MTALTSADVNSVAESPDGKALFVSIQHPGKNTSASMFTAGMFESNWPGNGLGSGSARPRSATLMTPKDDGDVIGL